MTKKTNTFRYLTQKETDAAVIEILDVLLMPLEYSGKHRKGQWEKGWRENLTTNSIIPRYFGKHQINRFNGRFILPFYKNYEVNALHKLVNDVTKDYFRDIHEIYEFGCGTGHNLQFMYRKYPGVLHGLDWTTSSQEVLRKQGIDAHNFDFFNPSSLKLKPKAGVITVAALEQTGTDYKKFVTYLLKNKPKVVIHIEPIPELLDPNDLLDYLSIKYMEKRKYLSGYFTYLQSLEAKGKIKILEARRSGVGSMFIDGYSIIAWKPL